MFEITMQIHEDSYNIILSSGLIVFCGNFFNVFFVRSCYGLQVLCVLLEIVISVIISNQIREVILETH